MALEVREYQYRAAISNLDYGFTRQKGAADILYGGAGSSIDRFAASQTEGPVWLHGYGNVFEKLLGPGEQIDVEPGGWIYREESVRMDPMVYGLRTGIFGGTGNLVFNRFTGPGRAVSSPCTFTCRPKSSPSTPGSRSTSATEPRHRPASPAAGVPTQRTRRPQRARPCPRR